jgi:AraC-like DNA-binding protein
MTQATPQPTSFTWLSSSPTEADLHSLAAMIDRYMPADGRSTLPLPNVHAIRASRPNTEVVHGVFKPSVCIVAQGAKRVYLGSEMFEYNQNRLLMCSMDLPVTAEVVEASHAAPYLGLILDLDLRRLSELTFKVFPRGLPPVRENRGVYLGDATSDLVNAATRLLKVMGDVREMELLAPMILDEILIRLLRSPVGGRLAQLAQAESHLQRVARAVDWVRAHFDEPMNVEALSELVHMSPSSFHAHFKTVTNQTPVQFQKSLRLREARRLMLNAGLDVTTASRRVGYVSSSQFIREYGRMFGNAPARDVTLLREQSQLPAAMN